MPTFKGQVSEEEIYELIAYLKSLHRGQTPHRVESYPPAQDNASHQQQGVSFR